MQYPLIISVMKERSYLLCNIIAKYKFMIFAWTVLHHKSLYQFEDRHSILVLYIIETVETSGDRAHQGTKLGFLEEGRLTKSVHRIIVSMGAKISPNFYTASKLAKWLQLQLSADQVVFSC